MNFGTDVAQPLLLSLVFTIFGVLVFGAGVWLIQRLVPFSIRKEIEEDHNVALGIVMAALILGLAIILAASLIDFDVVVHTTESPAPPAAPVP